MKTEVPYAEFERNGESKEEEIREREREEKLKNQKEGRNSGNSILGGNLPRENRKGKKSKISFIDDFICICEEFASKFANTDSVQKR
mmetsp:Transcript_36046/g.41028  ORF Transcript_36046/g.41028 Transcript_36046/m.41028 type:complete len:87 (+) Transcript_36046:209-469(+)